MRRIALVILMVFVIVGSFSCKKKGLVTSGGDSVLGEAKIRIINTISDSVYLLMNGHDIATGTLPHIFEMVVPPGGALDIPRTDLKNAYRYEYDWHTKDYTYSNWWATGADGKAVELILEYYADTTDYEFALQGQQRNDLLRCLDGDGLSSYWQPTDAFNASGTSVWATLTDEEKAHSFIIYRHHTIKHTYPDSTGAPIASNFSFALDLSQPRTWLRVDQPSDRYILTNNLQGIAPLSQTNMDKIYYAEGTQGSGGNIEYNGPFYLLERKSVER